MREFISSYRCASHAALQHFSKHFLLLLHFLGKHASVKDENEAMAGEDDRLQYSLGSGLD